MRFFFVCYFEAALPCLSKISHVVAVRLEEGHCCRYFTQGVGSSTWCSTTSQHKSKKTMMSEQFLMCYCFTTIERLINLLSYFNPDFTAAAPHLLLCNHRHCWMTCNLLPCVSAVSAHQSHCRKIRPRTSRFCRQHDSFTSHVAICKGSSQSCTRNLYAGSYVHAWNATRALVTSPT